MTSEPLPHKILLIDDDVELVEMLADYLVAEHFEVVAISDAEDGLAEALSEHYDIVVLDVMMPRLSGVEILSQLRRDNPVPVLMLTARGDDADRILGLELGADDYVPKPCTGRELVARIRAILRRTASKPQPARAPIAAGLLNMWPDQLRAEWDGEVVALTSTEFGLLEMLARHAGQLVTKKELSEEVLGRPLSKFDRSIEVHISSIRRKLGSHADGRSCIQTVVRRGYQFVTE